jgi:cation:H+ antiporter
MDVVTLVLFLIGLVILIVGAELLVKGAARLAAAAGISPLVIGLTVVAFGTSAPEMIVSVSTALRGQADLAIGNVVGSNIFNVLFILGISAIITPLLVSKQLIRLDVPIMIGVSILTLLFSLDGTISLLEGVLLFAGIIAYTAFLIAQARREKAQSPAPDEFDKEYGVTTKKRSPLIDIGFVVAGLFLLVVGSNWLVNGAIAIARWAGVDELVIGLTIVAAGTSLPEVATSILAAIRKERDIAVGNVVGSNIFNILAVLGLSSIVAPNGLTVAPAILDFDMFVMIAVAVACLPIFFTGNEIARWEGVVFLGYYVAYTAYLVFANTQHAALPWFSNIMLFFVVPLTVLTLIVTGVRALKSRGSGRLGESA